MRQRSGALIFGEAIRSNRSEERRVGKSVDLGGRRIIKKKNNPPTYPSHLSAHGYAQKAASALPRGHDGFLLKHLHLHPKRRSRHHGAAECLFSSRRRHTRCLSAWSSDVCSSDLRLKGFVMRSFARRRAGLKAAVHH